MTKGQKVKLLKTLYAAQGGGVAIGPNQGKHQSLELTGSGAAQFPINAGAGGVITEVSQLAVTVDYGNATIKFKKDGFGSFNQVQL